jgi:hypothetical protein
MGVGHPAQSSAGDRTAPHKRGQRNGFHSHPAQNTFSISKFYRQVHGGILSRKQSVRAARRAATAGTYKVAFKTTLWTLRFASASSGRSGSYSRVLGKVPRPGSPQRMIPTILTVIILPRSRDTRHSARRLNPLRQPWSGCVLRRLS